MVGSEVRAWGGAGLAQRASRKAPGNSAPAARAAAAVTLAMAAACWLAALRQMDGMDMGVATRLGPLAPFLLTWSLMMAAMMLPGAVPAVVRRSHTGGLAKGLQFVGVYLVLWSLAGVVVYAADRPHGTLAAGFVVLAAGAYELTPFKQRCRRLCLRCGGSGLEFALMCAGSSAGLMAILLALGAMSVPWMVLVALVVTLQKFLPANAAVDVPLALAIAGLGLLILLSPMAVPGLLPAM
jgi:predicted metal-binding membrane protein